MSTLPSGTPAPQPSQPRFNTDAAHQQHPKLRPVRGFAAQGQGPDGKQMQLLGIADARQISEKNVFLSPAAQMILPLMDGNRGVDDIVTEVGHGLTRPLLENIIAQLDEAALLEGPVFDALLSKIKSDFDGMDILPPAVSAQFTDSVVEQAVGEGATPEQKAAQGPKRVGEIFDLWMSKALENVENPSLDTLPKAIVVPHLDYQRGWINYASSYGKLRVCDRPDRIVILGTNHFGACTGVCGCNKGYETPMGICPADTAMIELMRAKLGELLFENRYDHEHEHSIELQIMWIQHIFGKDDAGNFMPVFGALIHDPTVNNGQSYDGQGIGLEPFVAALKSAITELPGRTLVVSSADLSHTGPAFGDKQPLAGESQEATDARNKILQHDHEMIQLVAQNKPAELVASMAWQQNPTRWCSIGNLVATLLTVEPTQVDLLNFSAAMDQQGLTMVSSVSMVMS
ncbi:MAG: AmmeMemoRadiSam system protein B [Pyrinomonadaceae bacterium]|nr:AmmeMemoRadiSam system protein B [Phycisphaerales bacterium]